MLNTGPVRIHCTQTSQYHLQCLLAAALPWHQPASGWEVPVRDGCCAAVLSLTQRGIHRHDDWVIMRKRVKLIIEDSLSQPRQTKQQAEAETAVPAAQKTVQSSACSQWQLLARVNQGVDQVERECARKKRERDVGREGKGRWRERESKRGGTCSMVVYVSDGWPT